MNGNRLNVPVDLFNHATDAGHYAMTDIPAPAGGAAVTGKHSLMGWDGDIGLQSC